MFFRVPFCPTLNTDLLAMFRLFSRPLISNLTPINALYLIKVRILLVSEYLPPPDEY
jgi:hypothetical protein